MNTLECGSIADIGIALNIDKRMEYLHTCRHRSRLNGWLKWFQLSLCLWSQSTRCPPPKMYSLVDCPLLIFLFLFQVHITLNKGKRDLKVNVSFLNLTHYTCICANKHLNQNEIYEY